VLMLPLKNYDVSLGAMAANNFTKKTALQQPFRHYSETRKLLKRRFHISIQESFANGRVELSTAPARLGPCTSF
jgi:hypothetical protein